VTTDQDHESRARTLPIQSGSGKRGFQVAFQLNSKHVRKSFSMIKDAENFVGCA